MKLFLSGWLGSYLPRWAKAVTLAGVLVLLVLILLPGSLTRTAWATALYFLVLAPLVGLRAHFWWKVAYQGSRQRLRELDGQREDLLRAP